MTFIYTTFTYNKKIILTKGLFLFKNEEMIILTKPEL